MKLRKFNLQPASTGQVSAQKWAGSHHQNTKCLSHSYLRPILSFPANLPIAVGMLGSDLLLSADAAASAAATDLGPL